MRVSPLTIINQYKPSLWLEPTIRVAVDRLLSDFREEKMDDVVGHLYFMRLGETSFYKLVVPPGIDLLFSGKEIKPVRLFDVLHGVVVTIGDGHVKAIPPVMPRVLKQIEGSPEKAGFDSEYRVSGGICIGIFRHQGVWYVYTDLYTDRSLYELGRDWMLGADRFERWSSMLWLINPVWFFKYSDGRLRFVGVRDMDNKRLFIPAQDIASYLSDDLGFDIVGDDGHLSVLAAKTDIDNWAILDGSFSSERREVKLSLSALGYRYERVGNYLFYELLDVFRDTSLFSKLVSLERDFVGGYLSNGGVLMYDDICALRGHIWDEVLASEIRKLCGRVVSYYPTFRTYWYGYDISACEVYGGCQKQSQGAVLLEKRVEGDSVRLALQTLKSSNLKEFEP